jgi:hypothetical protein
MQVSKAINGITYKFKNKLFVFKFWKCYNLHNEKRKNILFQFNRFENGYCTMYLRLFKKYSFYISDLKSVKNKRLFIGNKDYYNNAFS